MHCTPLSLKSVRKKIGILITACLLLSNLALPQRIVDEDDAFSCAAVAFNEGLYELSIEFLNKYFTQPEAEKNDYALFLYGINLLKLKKYQESLTKFEQLLKKFPNSTYNKEVRKYIIIIQMFLNMPFEAWENYRNEIAAGGRDPEIEKNLGYMLLNEMGKLLQSGDYGKAENTLNHMEQVFNETDIVREILYYQGLVLYQKNNFELAEKKFTSAIAFFKNHKLEPEILLKLGDCLFNLKKYAESQKYYDEIIARFPRSEQAEWAKFQTSLIYKRNMKYKEARKILSGLLKTTNSDILLRSLWELGKIAELEDKKDEAITWYNKLLETTKNEEILLRTKLQLGYIYFNQKNYKKTIEIFSEYLKQKHDQDIMNILGTAFYNNDQIDSAVNTWEQLFKENPDYPFSIETLKIMYNFYREKENREMMKNIFDTMLKKYPEDNFILTEGIMFINEIIDTGKTEEAMGYLKKFETKKNPELMFLNAKILYLNGNYQDSEKMLKEIDKKSPFAPEALFLLIDINLKKSMIKEAQIYYVKLLTLFPKTVWAQKAQAMMAKYKTGR